MSNRRRRPPKNHPTYGADRSPQTKISPPVDFPKSRGEGSAHNTRRAQANATFLGLYDTVGEPGVSETSHDASVFSAHRILWTWQRHTLIVGFAMLVIAMVYDPAHTLAVLFALFAIPFMFVAAFRLFAIWRLVDQRFANPPKTARQNNTARDHNTQQNLSTTEPRLKDDDLPTYAILVPLFKEAHVVPSLLSALRKLDYPQDRLQISFITESIDLATTAALKSSRLDDNMRVVVVPEGKPRTKPRALNYALQTARGEVVVVFDAEDVPEPDQLRRAAAMLASAPGQTGCVQARLNVYNPKESWFTRQFTIEYTSLFDAILPSLEHLRVPVPLGGTSNHFPRKVLERVGAWDPFNVTEDADLGIRLARFGYGVTVLPSTTWEEAPVDFKVWFGQRTRWMKGWMQTYLVHMRQPRRTNMELGLRGFLGFQALMVSLILSPLVHPLFYMALASGYFTGGLSFSLHTAQTPTAISWFFWIGFFNLIIGYTSAMALGAICVTQRGWQTLMIHCLTMPIYWLLISLAAYRALYELVSAPHHWEKTDHAVIRNWVIPTHTAREK